MVLEELDIHNQYHHTPGASMADPKTILLRKASLQTQEVAELTRSLPSPLSQSCHRCESNGNFPIR